LTGISPFQVKSFAFEVGFDLCGITTPEPIPRASESFKRWLGLDMHGEMEYLASDPERRTNPAGVMPSVKSIIMLGLNYHSEDSVPAVAELGKVSRYARGKDYHKIIEKKTKRLIRRIRDWVGPDNPCEMRWFVDYGPMLERSYAERAGLGFIGKNSMLISRQFGSWLFLSEILTDLELPPDDRHLVNHGRCGKCTRCVDACPTGAIVADHVVDSRKCISYLTIERPSEIPPELSRKMGNLVFGCDICQEVCPHNGRAVLTRHKDLLPESGVGETIPTREILAMNSRDEFLKLTAGTPLTRTKLDGLKRNAAIVLHNSRSEADS